MLLLFSACTYFLHASRISTPLRAHLSCLGRCMRTMHVWAVAFSSLPGGARRWSWCYVFLVFCWQDSKRAFLHDCVNEGDEKEKLETFINFCEDTIFEVMPGWPVFTHAHYSPLPLLPTPASASFCVNILSDVGLVDNGPHGHQCICGH